MMSDQDPLILDEGGNSIEYMAGVLEQERTLISRAEQGFRIWCLQEMELERGRQGIKRMELENAKFSLESARLRDDERGYRFTMGCVLVCIAAWYLTKIIIAAIAGKTPLPTPS